MQQGFDSEAIKAFATKYKVPILIGLGVALVLMMTEQQGQPLAQGGGGPVYDAGGSTPVYDAGGSGGGAEVDMDAWRREQERDDGIQRDRVDAIREVERCYDPDTGREYEVSIHVGC